MHDGPRPVTTRVRLAITGVVQGVGFRPFVHRLATELGLDGCVGNDSAGVVIDGQGPADAVDDFVRRVVTDAPPLAMIESVARTEDAPIERPSGFSITPSRTRPGAAPTLVSPDRPPCSDCLTEMFDPADRRVGHPFVNCTNCGPRFTITRRLPYDRPTTTMAGFAMCPDCEREYHDPADRRFHAQPIACNECGPRLRFVADGPGGPEEIADSATAIARTIAALVDGGIVAVKGLGGFHLVCDATNEAAVSTLRARKSRPDKPFAVMVADRAMAERLAHLGPVEAEILESGVRPVVLVRSRPGGVVSASVAPGNPLIGIMAPSTPIHHLLLADGRLDVLVMTSGNLAGEPIVHRDDEVGPRLGGLVDAVLGHDRPIHVPCDDSVVRVVEGRMLPIRRARGMAPLPITLDLAGPSVLAVGGELKSTFAVGRPVEASGAGATTRLWVSQHIGDLENLATQEAFEAGVDQWCELYGIDPDLVVVDAHPGYRSSRWARSRFADRVVAVQHHEAHVAAVIADNHHRLDRPVIGVAFDGTGYGHDGTIWGGEIFAGTVEALERVAHLAPVPLPGGDQAIRHPARVALAHLWHAGIDWDEAPDPSARFDPAEQALLRRQLERSVACVPTTSMGRLFDAVASLIGLRHSISFEAQAAIDLEQCATRAAHGRRYRFGILADPVVGSGPLVFDPAPVVRAVLADHRAGIDRSEIALGFHEAVVDVMATIAERIRTERRIDTVALSGGVFQNALLVDLARRRLEHEGFAVLTHRTFPANDGGLALGQAMLGLARHRHRTIEEC